MLYYVFVDCSEIALYFVESGRLFPKIDAQIILAKNEEIILKAQYYRRISRDKHSVLGTYNYWLSTMWRYGGSHGVMCLYNTWLIYTILMVSQQATAKYLQQSIDKEIIHLIIL